MPYITKIFSLTKKKKIYFEHKNRICFLCLSAIEIEKPAPPINGYGFWLDDTYILRIYEAIIKFQVITMPQISF